MAFEISCRKPAIRRSWARKVPSALRATGFGRTETASFTISHKPMASCAENLDYSELASPRQRQHQRAQSAERRGDQEHGEIGGMDGVLGKDLIDVHETSSLRMEVSLHQAKLMG
jgi:hypothetical protein